jgi:mannitol-specific phosphotransferase system IIBC component
MVGAERVRRCAGGESGDVSHQPEAGALINRTVAVEINLLSQTVSIIVDVLIAIIVLALFVTLRNDRQSSNKIAETLDRISATQSQISVTQSQISETQKDQSRIQQDMLTRLAVMDAKGWGNNPNG